MTVTVTELKLVNFPAGYLRHLHGTDEKRISWDREYVMIVPRGRKGVYFAMPEDIDGATDPFPKAALRRTFEAMLKIEKTNQDIHDRRTDIRARRVGAAIEIDMPCGENACIKRTTIARLIKELAPA